MTAVAAFARAFAGSMVDARRVFSLTILVVHGVA